MKIPKKRILVQKKEKLDIKKYISRPQPHQLNNRVLTNYNTSEYKSDISSPLHTSIHNSSHILTQPKYTYLLTSSNDSLNLKTEANDNNHYNKYLETFPIYNRNKNNIYSEKIKTYRKNLDEIVNKLNESNDKYRKIINKEKKRLNINNDFNKNYFDEYYAQTPKYLTNNNRSKLINNIDTLTYNQRNKNNVLKNFGDRTDIRQKSLINNNEIDKMNKDNNDTLANINKLRNEFKQISSNYLDVSQKIDSLTIKQNENDDISYEEIIRNNSKLNDILNYNYKVNNDLENEKVFILMKLRLKNAEIMINKLVEENKKYMAKINKYNNLAKLNNKLEIENKNLKFENEKLNININLIKKEFEDDKNKYNDINIPKNEIIEKNILSDNNDINKDKENIIINNKDNKIKELKEKYKMIYKDNKNLKLILQDVQSKYIILQNIHLELKQKISEADNKEIILLKKELNNLNKKCKNYEKRISELNKIENKYKEITRKQEEKKIKNEKSSFCDLFKKYANDKLKENKLKMIIGIYLKKQNIKFNQNIKEYKDKNKKLVKSVRKLNDQLIEFKLKKLNNTNNKYDCE